MENEIEEKDAVSSGRFGDVGRLFIAPIAILIALIGGMIFGMNIDMNDFVVPLVVLGCASVIATTPIFEKNSSEINSQLPSLKELLFL